MALQKGERYRCPDQECGCEIEVTKVPSLVKVEIWLRAAVVVRRCRK
jgi:hypothetical protein